MFALIAIQLVQFLILISIPFTIQSSIVVVSTLPPWSYSRCLPPSLMPDRQSDTLNDSAGETQPFGAIDVDAPIEGVSEKVRKIEPFQIPSARPVATAARNSSLRRAREPFGVQDEEKEKAKKHKMDEDELRMQLKAILDSNKANMLQISSEMKSLHTSVTGFDARIQTMEQAIDTKFVGIDGRMEKLDSLLPGFDNGVKASVTEVLNDVVAPRMSAVEEIAPNSVSLSNPLKISFKNYSKLSHLHLQLHQLLQQMHPLLLSRQ